VICVFCILCLIVVPLPLGKNPFALQLNNNLIILNSHSTIRGSQATLLYPAKCQVREDGRNLKIEDQKRDAWHSDRILRGVIYIYIYIYIYGAMAR
jgi:hypothetical protein